MTEKGDTIRMSELGRLLAEARAAKKLSLAETEAVTRIRQKYLDALERGDYAALLRGVIARGFLRSYARFLGLDEADALRRYSQESGDASEEIAIAEPGKPRLVDYRPIEVALMDSQRGLGWLRWAVAAVVVLAVAGGLWWLLGRNANWNPLAAFGPAPTPIATATALPTRPMPTPTPPPPPTAPPIVATPTSDLLTLPTPTVPPTLTSTPRPTATPEVVGRIVMTAKITQRAWLRVTVDGKEALAENLEAGQTRTWEASQAMTILTGNAGGVVLTLNNQELGAMGGIVQVVERTWVVVGGQVSEAPGTVTPTPRPTNTATPTG